MIVVEVEVVEQWTDRGDTDWVKIRVIGAKQKKTMLDVEPEKIIQLQRSLIEGNKGIMAENALRESRQQ